MKKPDGTRCGSREQKTDRTRESRAVRGTGAHELLAPAGSFDTAKEVIAAGADAVYLAGTRFGARAYAANLQTEELLAIIDYAHLYGRQIHLTVNTLLKNRETETELYDFICPLYMQGLDAVIVQDFGVFRFLKENFPDLALHASTQMSVTSAAGARFLQRAGASRIVAARELSLSEIRFITEQTDIEVESFIHGALCYSFSGQCLLSSIIGGRSGNRGRCAQPCRLPYRVEDEDGRIYNKHADYPLSPKDLCALDLLPQLCEAGVCSFKIEGRMKQGGYAAGVTEVYRRYLDLYETDPQKFAVTDADRRLLLELGSRGDFTKGYYVQRNGRGMLADRDSSYYKKGADKKGADKKGADKKGADKKSADKKVADKKSADVPGRQKGTDAAAYQKSTGADRREPEKIPVCLRCGIRSGEPICLEARLPEDGIGVTVSGETAQAAQNRPLTAEEVSKRLKKTGDTPFAVSALDLDLDGESFLPVRAINEARREALYALEEKILRGYRRGCPENMPMPAARQDRAKAAVPHPAQTGEDTDGGQLRTAGTAGHTPGGEQTACSRRILRVMIAEPGMLQTVLSYDFIDEILFDLREDVPLSDLEHMCDAVRARNKKCVFCFPHIFRADAQQNFHKKFGSGKEFGALFDEFLVRSYDSLGFAMDTPEIATERIRTDYNLYQMSVTASEAFRQLGLRGGTVSQELNHKELMHQDSSLEMIVYGLQPVMLSAQCIYKNYQGCSGRKADPDSLSDKPAFLVLREAERPDNVYPVCPVCRDCYNIIYAGRPLYLLDVIGETGFAYYRLSFVRETARQIGQILDCCVRTLDGEAAVLPVPAAEFGKYFTRGHYNRGVE